MEGDYAVQGLVQRPSQICSIGLRSGDLEGQSILQISSSPRKSLIILALCGRALSSINWLKSTPEQSYIGFKDLIPIAMCIDITIPMCIPIAMCINVPHRRREVMYGCPTLDHLRHRFLCHKICRFLLRRTDDSELFPLFDEFRFDESHSCGKSRLITEKITPPFKLCPRLLCSKSQQAGFFVGFSQTNALTWSPGIKRPSLQDAYTVSTWKFLFQTQ